MSGITLTFDDGPDLVWTPRLLDLLAECGARATFFPISARVETQPSLIERMVREGHTVGLHCRDHLRHTDRDAAWLRRDTGAALATLARHGADPQVWRAPWGVRAPWTEDVAREHGLRLVGWTVDTHDWRGDSAQDMLDSTQDGLVGGAIVLAHDGIGPGARRRTPAQTLRYVELVVELAAQRGLPLTALAVGAAA
jgi:peptidoglycan/xylan/chitin deacetylase (PgdA/CDA1 family)